MLSLVLIAVALVSALTAMRFAIHGQEVQIPAIVGMTPAEAERAVSALGLMLEVERQYYSPQIAEGRIMSQLPLPGTKVRRGWQVRVAQSMGPQRVAIPDVIKESERAAEWNIRRRGLDLATVAELPLPGVPPDQVVAQSPPANASQVAAPRISLLLAVAADDPAYVMPSFCRPAAGKRQPDFAGGRLQIGECDHSRRGSRGRECSRKFFRSPQPSPASIVMVQSPSAGQKVSAGATINLAVR